MDIQEIKKDVKNMHVSKNVIIGILAVALVSVSAVAIGLGVDRGEHGDRGEHNRRGMMEQGYDDHNVNPNDGETNDDQATSTSQNTSMNNTMSGMMSGLQGKTGDAFDKEFLSEMIVHHQGAVEMAKAVLSTSKRPELIKLANDIISAQTKEIDMMKGWQATWFK